MSSLQDVAKLAGVSNTLVSRTINNQSGVSEKNKKKILAAMEALHYEPNALARSLVKRRTGTIGIVMDTLCEPYFFPLIEGLESAIDTTGKKFAFTVNGEPTNLTVIKTTGGLKAVLPGMKIIFR